MRHRSSPSLFARGNQEALHTVETGPRAIRQTARFRKFFAS
ncbi:hypothetical protein HNE_1180 [Hyphomonas neptunium ATCC 15444]|uniref:Uncharacterized protein n=1 Tax=Hyphomonas neptunium (strain ATCC 15444) TaxID=228405 RepID=Q0C2Z5_HYPNA|nr:hypothetical protein HNE_1180 [Hyphomonas neptunium ATCC 15444]